ncbi:Efflux transporter periplasmic adaptor subunit [Vibrio chagasii]|uniref:efflux RND transporter periplasmic adaptor subunit n=1 Tax=Vibrio TaxID=662 RepID=UPI00076ADF0E|nr:MULTISPECIES: efflux RND transporter periplasmic adaptor subunit [Vibrio]CAH6797921.1 Efflux transporter periplasmic adaptor subunit [Vibrio chagasii]NOI86506.1 efflux RND transporter periplasmic adaptor subunit [Vibrio sp. 99K-1]CAH6876744.1 Efflux transporter periplasmic adaptor subunit [Vibrio chagasii]CAH6896606.1 Efflux transporter periplasmic adaptor subunit [Vibrio chagasii]CAH6897924.1 Efflux transporter periplasmic adaptor subunit [Vibrio chagasii]
MYKLMKGSAVAVALSTLLVGCGENTQAETPSDAAVTAESNSTESTVLTVETVALERSPSYEVQREYVGVVKAGQQANLGFELAGKVNEILVDVGDTVTEGQPLIKLDTQLLKTESSQLKAQAEEVKAQLSLVAANLKRQRSLKAKGFSAEAEIDSLTSEQRVLQANLLRIDASVKGNDLKLVKSTILAPYSGTIATRFVSLGDVVNVGNPTLTLLASEGKEAFIGIPAHQMAKVTSLSSPSIRVGRDDYDVTLLNPGAMVDTQSRSVGLRYLFPEQATVLEGQLAYLKFDEQIDDQGYWVPLTGLIDGLRGVWNIFVIGDGNKVERRSVQVLFANNQQAYVSGAIEDGEQVIASGLHRLVPGQTVKPVTTAAE